MYALVDCNNFYASCERLFQPRLAKQPVVVLSNNDGCVIARSQEAKDLGIEMGAPSFQWERFFVENKVQVFSSNYALYGDLSNRVMQTLATFTPNIEIYSIDESFLDVSKMPYLDLFEYAKEIKATVYKNVGIPVSIGIAPSKTLAKMANRFTKKNSPEVGVWALPDQAAIDTILEKTKVGDIWGIGAKHSAFLKIKGINTALELSKMPDDWVRTNLSVVGLRLVHELRGIPCIEFEDTPPAKQCICTSRSFGTMLTRLDELKQAVSTHASACAAKLRKQNSCTGLIHVFINTNIHRLDQEQYSRSISIKINVETNDTSEIIKYAMLALQRIYKNGYSYKKAGVIVMEIVPETQIQHSLFDTVNREKQNNLMKVFDGINLGMGKNTVKFAVQGNGKKWKLKQERLSPCYTTRMAEILKVKI